MKIWLVEKSEEEQMKRKMELEDLKEFYHTDNIREGTECYEYVDETTGIIFGLPQDFQVFIDGSLLDPIKMLKMPPYIWSLVFDNEIFPLEVSYLCGYCSVVSKKIRFYPGDPMSNDDLGKMDAVLIKAHWDSRERVSDSDWPEYLFGGRKIWSLRKTDQYEISGDRYWLLRTEVNEWLYFGITALFALYVRTLRPVYDRANLEMKQFEEGKAYHRKNLVEELNKLPGRIHWIVAADEEELWPKYDANRELWEKNEYDWQIIIFDDYLEIRRRGSSSGVISVKTIRYDERSYKCAMTLLEEVK